MSNIAMDPLSITTSTLSLCGVALGVVRIVRSCRDYPTESFYVFNQLELAKKTLHFWREDVGISGELQHSQHERLGNPEILALVNSTLALVNSTLALANSTPLYIDYLSPEEALSQMKSEKWNSILIRLKWAFADKKKCLSQVQRIRDSVQSLHLLVPLRGTAQPSMSMDRQLITSYMFFEDTDGTHFDLKVKDCIPVKVHSRQSAFVIPMYSSLTRHLP
jgi:hypothetical protein